MMSRFPFYQALFLILFVACNYEEDTPAERVPFDLWVDETAMYLPKTAEWTNRAEVADLDGDGDIDILFANGGDYSEPGVPEPLRVFLNEGDSVPFREVTRDIFGDDTFLARVVKVRDLNKDSLPDIFIGTTYETQSRLYLNRGNGIFEDVTATHLPDLVASVGDLEFGDVDLDGDLDVALSNWGPGNNMTNDGGRTLLWLNDGEGKFSSATESHMPDLLIEFSWDLELVDVDNDFDLDMAVSCKRCATSRLFINDGTGHYENKRMLPAYTNNYEFEPMDVNRDGFLDLVKGNSWSRREHLFLNDSGKRFRDVSDDYWPSRENTGEDDNNVVFLDYDSDGDPDFLLSSLTGEDRLLINDGTGRFTLAEPVIRGEATGYTLSLVLADLNHDNKLDIVMGQGEGKESLEERIFLGNSIAPDTSPPVISNYTIHRDSINQTLTVLARIHDNKTPNMPQDWSNVVLSVGSDNQMPMEWYGENLWRITIPEQDFTDPRICAMDRAGNNRCRNIRIR